MDKLSEILEQKGRVVHSTAPEATIQEIAAEMSRLHIGSLMVLDRGRPLGIVTERDIMSKVVAVRRDPATTPVREIMSKDVICVGLHATCDHAMSIMTQHRVRHLPVVIDGRVAGMISIGDLVRWTSTNQQHEIEMLNDYLTGKYPG